MIILQLLSVFFAIQRGLDKPIPSYYGKVKVARHPCSNGLFRGRLGLSQ